MLRKISVGMGSEYFKGFNRATFYNQLLFILKRLYIFCYQFQKETPQYRRSEDLMDRVLSYCINNFYQAKTEKQSKIKQSIVKMDSFLKNHASIPKKSLKNWHKISKCLLILSENSSNRQLVLSSSLKRTQQIGKLVEFLKKSHIIKNNQQKQFNAIQKDLLSKIKSNFQIYLQSQIKYKDIEALDLQYHLLNPRYFCTSAYLVYNRKVNPLQFENHFIKMKKEDFYDKESEKNREKMLQRFLCAGLNSGKCYLTVGIDQNNIIKGETFEEKEKEQIYKKIDEKNNKVFPNKTKQVRVKFIPVCNLQNTEKLFIEGVFVLLLQFNSNMQKCFYYIKSNSFMPKQQDGLLQIKGQALYRRMHKVCFESYHQKIIHDECVQPQIGNILVQDNTQQLNSSFNEYHYNSVLIIPGYKQPGYVEKFAQILKHNQSSCKVFAQPYSKLNEDHFRKIYLLNHDDRHKIIQEFISKFDKEKCVELYPLHKNIIVTDEKAKQKLGEFYIQYNKYFQKQHPKQENRKWKKDKKVFTVLRFQYWNQVLFGFIFFLKFDFRLQFYPTQKINTATTLIKNL